MTEWLITHVEQLAVHAPTWGLVLVLVFMTIESSFIPFPSEVVMIPAGFLAARGEFTFALPALDLASVVVAGTAGSLLGAHGNYFLARYAGQPFFERFGRYIGLPPAKLHRAEALFRRYGAGATFVSRLLPAIRQLISLPAGLARMPLRSFTLWTAAGAGLWVTVLAITGYGLGASTADLAYAELVPRASALIRAKLDFVVPATVLIFVAYVALSRRIMRERLPPPAVRPEPERGSGRRAPRGSSRPAA